MPLSAKQGFFTQPSGPPPTAWTPADVSNLVGWYDSQDTANMTLSNTTTIETWDSKTGGNISLNRVTPGGNNTGLGYDGESGNTVTTGEVINSLTTVKWESSRMDANNFTNIIDANRTVTVAYFGHNEFFDYIHNRKIFTLQNNSLEWWFVQNDYNSMKWSMIEGYGGTEAMAIGADSPGSNIDWQIAVVSMDTFGNTRVRLNGTNLSILNNLDAGQTAWNRFAVGAWTDNAGFTKTANVQYGMVCSMGDICVDNQYWSSSDTEKFEGYVAHKYARTDLLPANHPYKTSAPTT